MTHTFAVKKYLETRDLYEVCKRLNHDKLSTTQIYAQFSFKRLEQDFPSMVKKGLKTAKNGNSETTYSETTTQNNYVYPREAG